MLKSLFNKNKQSQTEEILNEGLSLAMAFGKNWQVSTQARFSQKYPHLSETELDEYNQLFLDALKLAHDLVYILVSQNIDTDHVAMFNEQYIARYPWVSAKNLKGLYRQAVYYADREMCKTDKS